LFGVKTEMKRLHYLLFLILVLGAQMSVAQERKTTWQSTIADSVLISQTYFTPLKDLCRNKKVLYPPSQLKIVVEKSRYILSLYSGDSLLKRYPIALGLNPTDDKVRQGDYSTPEGEFYVCALVPNSAFYKAFLISYPNADDAKRGLRDKLITKAQYQQIINAIRQGRTPPQNTRLGGEIEIHGNGIGSNWTWGCVALENKDVDELWEVVKVGTKVVIRH
jgi:murein L,D-transpeptidase YafK